MIPPDVAEYAGRIEGELAQLETLRRFAPGPIGLQIDDFIRRTRTALDPQKMGLLDLDAYTKGLWLSWAQNTLETARILKDAVNRGFQALA